MKKVLLILILCIGIFPAVLTGCATSKEPCVECGSTPTKAFTTSTGKTLYYCERHYSTCAFCSNKATKHYTNLLETLVFVCDKHYKVMTEK